MTPAFPTRRSCDLLGERGKHLLALLGVFAARHRHGRGACVRSPVALGRDGRSQFRLFNLAAAAHGATHQLAPPLVHPVFGRTEPCLENMRRRTADIENDHLSCTGAENRRRWRMAGTRPRTSSTRAMSISHKATPGSVPMSSSPSPHGSMTSA